MNDTTVTVPEAELRTVLITLATADKMLGPAFALIPGYAQCTEAHAVLSLLLRDAADGMPPDPVQGFDTIAIGHHEIYQSYQRAFGDEEFAKAAALEFIRAVAIASVSKISGAL